LNRNKVEKALVVSDLHIPNHDKELVDLVLFKFGKDFKPDVIFLDGDIMDNFSVSRYQKHPSIQLSLAQELVSVKAFLEKVRHIHKDSRIEYIFGNHEHRLETYIIDNAPELFDQVNLEQLLATEGLDIEVHRSIYKENYIQYGDLYIGHFDCVASKGGSTAQKLLQTKGVSILQGHIHRFGASAIRHLDRTIYGFENPCLALMDQSYGKDMNWQQGFSIIHKYKGTTWVEVVPIKNRSFIAGGRYYQA